MTQCWIVICACKTESPETIENISINGSIRNVLNIDEKYDFGLEEKINSSIWKTYSAKATLKYN